MKNIWVWISAIVCVVLMLCAGGYVLVGAVGERRLSKPKAEARASVAVAAEEPDRIKRQVAVNRATLGQPMQSWSQVVCEIDVQRSGMFPDSHSQRCTFRQLDVYPITDKDRAVEVMHAHPHRGVGVSWTTSADDWPRPASAEKDDHWGTPRGTPPQWDVRGDLTGETYTMVGVFGDPVVTELGCSPWGIVVCRAPVDGPVMP